MSRTHTHTLTYAHNFSVTHRAQRTNISQQYGVSYIGVHACMQACENEMGAKEGIIIETKQNKKKRMKREKEKKRKRDRNIHGN